MRVGVWCVGGGEVRVGVWWVGGGGEEVQS